MKVRALKKILHEICHEGYADWDVFFYDEDGDGYTVNHIYYDDDGDVCLESTDMEGSGNYDFTASNILARLKRYNANDYVYFLEEFEDGDTYACDIEYKWYIGDDGYGDEQLCIDCHGMDD